MLRRVALVITYVSEERIASIFRVTRIGDLGTLAVTSKRSTQRRNTMEMLRSSEQPVLTRTTGCNIHEDDVLHILTL
jgi:hypothetical protein